MARWNLAGYTLHRIGTTVSTHKIVGSRNKSRSFIVIEQFVLLATQRLFKLLEVTHGVFVKKLGYAGGDNRLAIDGQPLVEVGRAGAVCLR